MASLLIDTVPVAPPAVHAIVAMDDSKPAAKQYYYAIRKCDSLQAPAIFLSKDDAAKFHLDREGFEDDAVIEYKTFDNILEAAQYVGVRNKQKLPRALVAHKPTTTALFARNNPNLNAPAKRSADDISQVMETAPKAMAITALALIQVTPSKKRSKQQQPAAMRKQPPSVVPSLSAAACSKIMAPAPTYLTAPSTYLMNSKQMDQATNFETIVDLLRQYKSKYGTLDITRDHWSVSAKSSTTEGNNSGEHKNETQSLGSNGRDNNDDKIPAFVGLDRTVLELRKQIKKCQRDPAGNSILTLEQCMRLLDMGFVLKSETTESIKKKEIKREKDMVKYEDNIKLLKEYKEQHGTCDIPVEHETIKNSAKYKGLDTWVRDMRTQIKVFQKDPAKSILAKSILDQARVQHLLDMGFVVKAERWRNEKRIVKLEGEWDEMLGKLKAYKDEHGDTNVPNASKRESPLRWWILAVREEFKRMQEGKDTVLNGERLSQLSNLGLDLVGVQRKPFEERCAEWLAFLSKHGKYPRGDCAPEEEMTLGTWVRKIRRKYSYVQEGKKTNLTKANIDLLNKLGFKWESDFKLKRGPAKATKAVIAAPKSWEERFQDLISYKQEHGDCLVPQTYPGLGSWVKMQRKQYQKVKRREKCSLSKERMANMEGIGFVFEVRLTTCGTRRSWQPHAATGSPSRNDGNVSSSEEEEEIEDYRGDQDHRSPGYNRYHTGY